jgi:hypothetical protein
LDGGASNHDGDVALDGGPTLATVAAEFASTDCARKFECMPYAAETRGFGDSVADCTQQETSYQMRSLSAPGASTDYSNIVACIAEMKAATCQDYVDGTAGENATVLPECWNFAPGTVPNGGGCAYGRQCKSDYCDSLEGQCGNCAALVTTPGAPCGGVSKVCDPAKGLICSSVTATCVVAQGRGANCTESSDCYPNLVCSATTGTCIDLPDTVGAPCNIAESCSFELGAGLACNNMSNMCELASKGGAGASCGFMQPNGGLLVCDAGFVCNGSIDGFSGTCVAGHAGAPGDKCAFVPAVSLPYSPPNGPPCEEGVQCVGGICTVDDPSTCH